jgi:cell division protein FtsL
MKTFCLFVIMLILFLQMITSIVIKKNDWKDLNQKVDSLENRVYILQKQNDSLKIELKCKEN